MNTSEQTDNALSEQVKPKDEGLFALPEVDGYTYDPMALPVGSMPEDDQVVGYDEFGYKIRETNTGVRYQVQPVTYRDVSLSERGGNIVKNVGSAYKAVTEDPLGTATGAVSGLAQGLWDTVSSVSDPNATNQDAMNIAGMVAVASAPKLLDAYDPNVTRIFAGPNAKNFPRGKENMAYRRLLAGEDPQKVYEDTGIQYLPQRKDLPRPVFNIDPKGASIRDFEAIKQVIPSTSVDQVTKGGDGTVRLPIKDVVDFSEFYDNYPQVEGFEVAFDPNIIKDTASFDTRNKTLTLSLQNLKDDNPDKIRSIVLHELQHGVQAVERTSGGAAPSYFLEKTKKIDPVTGLEKPGPWVTRSADMLNDVVKLNVLEKAAEKAKKDLKDNGSFASPLKALKLYKEVGKTEYAFKSERSKLEELAFKKYQENPGEIEARAAELWAELTPEERQKTLPSTLYDRAANEGYAVYARLGQEPIYGENYVPIGRLPVAKENELQKRLETVTPDTASTNQRFAKGGMVEEEQMNRLMQEGGMADDGMSKEPVTGNNIPPGALASEVRDDVDAKLSGGEYVVPADVLRYYGVRFFEDLRSQAKQGMMEMESAGRIGGVPVNPRGVPVQGQGEELTPEEEQMLAQAMSSTSGMAEGGVAFDRTQFTMPTYDASGYGSVVESRVYFDPATGNKQTINFMGGTALGSIPAGYVPWTQALQDAYNQTKTETKPKKGSRSSDDNDKPEPANYDSWLDQNYEAITSDPYEFGMNSLKKTEEDSNMPGLAGGLFGVLTGKDKDIQNIANANAALKLMEAKGLTGTEQYNTLTSTVKDYISQISPLEKGLILTKVAGTGNGYLKAIEEKGNLSPVAPTKPVVTPPTPPVTPAAAPDKTGGSSSGRDDRDQQGGSSTPPIGSTSQTSTSTSTNISNNPSKSNSSGYNPPKPTSTTNTGNNPGNPNASGYNKPYTTPKPVIPQGGRAGFEEGGLVPKPKKARAKTKGLAGKQ